MALSHAQAAEVAKRFNPAAGQLLWFTDDGSLLTGAEAQRAVAARKGEVYACRRSPDDVVEVARVNVADLGTGTEPAFGEAW